MGFHHVDQAGFELLSSGDLPTSASQNAGIIGVSHHAWLSNSIFNLAKTSILYSIAAVSFYMPTNAHKDFTFSSSLPILAVFFMVAILRSVRWFLVGLDVRFPDV